MTTTRRSGGVGDVKEGHLDAFAKERLLTGQTEYAQVIKMLGNGRLEARAFDDSGTMRLASIRGKLRKKVW